MPPLGKAAHTPPPLFTDSRRLLGPSRWLDGPGVVLDAPAPHGCDPAVLEGWRGRVLRVAAALGWGGVELSERPHARGTMLAFTAPREALLSATSLNEWALRAAAEERGAQYDPASLDEDALPVGEEAALAALRPRVDAEAAEHAAAAAKPGPGEGIPRRDLPTVLVTGSNGKTTTTRLVAAILRDHGHVVGYTSTEGVFIGDRYVERGDWSGPLGARRVLQDGSVTAAVLETARGGLLRRGLVVARADVAVITNVAEDHFGEYGIDTIEELARVKGLVARALGPGGVLVVNGDDPLLSPEGPESAGAPPFAAVPEGVRVERFSLVAPWPEGLPRMEDIPLTAGGRARYNAANALAAARAAAALGVPQGTIAATLRRFGTHPDDNPGRLVQMELGGVTILLDYAHNPHGLAALLEVARAAEPTRLGLLLGQAGDRDDEAIRELARVAWAAGPELVVLKDLAGYERGRAPGEVPELLRGELVRLGARADQLRTVLDETEAAREALRWARAGDLLVLAVHSLETRERVMALLAELRSAGWRAGDGVG